ncbi:RecB family exonuclease [Mycobacteroides chelonae]|nr:PD-(D/E)XK nuclease family protein [Mycobacteroides chelonae]
MIHDRVRFETDVVDIWGFWPPAPEHWSYSSLKDIEACPNRWMLSRADYPDIWESRGYPQLPAVATIFGQVVHSVIERLGYELGAAGISSPGVSDVVGLLSSLGGWQKIVLDAIEHQISRLDGNPRVSTERVNRVRDDLLRRLSEAADQVKTLLGRAEFPRVRESRTTASSEIAGSGSLTRRVPIGAGAHAEQDVTAAGLRMTGRVDRLTVDDDGVTITDFKTSQSQQDHDEQVRLYALLWFLDEQANPSGRLATNLVVAYPTGERSVAAPDREELRTLESATAARIEAADAIIRQQAPAAIPGDDNCRHCNVKHLCDVYWAAIPPAVAEVSADDWFDFEGRILRQNGTKSWFAEPVVGPPTEVLVRTVETDAPFPVGGRVRLLGVRRSQDPDDDDRLVIAMVATSEWYLVAS